MAGDLPCRPTLTVQALKGLLLQAAEAMAVAGAEAQAVAGAEMGMQAEAMPRTWLTNHRQALAWLLEATLVILASPQDKASNSGMACQNQDYTPD